MVLVFPYRPKTTNIIQEQPTNVEGGASSSNVTPKPGSVEVSTSDRQTVLEGGFGSDSDDYNWQFGPNRITNPDLVSQVNTTLNGFNATSVKYKTGSGPNDRWGGIINLPFLSGFTNPPGYSEYWYTQDFMFVSPHSCPVGFKLMASRGDGKDNVVDQPDVCDGGSSFGIMLSNSGGDLTGARKLHQYTFHVAKRRNRFNWDVVGGNQQEVIPLDTVARIEIHRVLNTGPNNFDGIMESRYDPGLVSGDPTDSSVVHSDPITVRARQSNIRFYCGDSLNLKHALCREIEQLHMYGGADSSWNNTQDSTFVFGRFKFEIPA